VAVWCGGGQREPLHNVDRLGEEFCIRGVRKRAAAAAGRGVDGGADGVCAVDAATAAGIIKSGDVVYKPAGEGPYCCLGNLASLQQFPHKSVPGLEKTLYWEE